MNLTLDTIFSLDKSIPEFDAILVAGPTASGKSAFALELARTYNGMVINADSMQVYKDLPILTARPSPQDEQAAPHALYGFVPADHAYSTGQWCKDIQETLKTCREKKYLPVITGGTGLYFSALLQGLSPIPDIPDIIRQKWRALGEELIAPQLHDILQKEDPVMASRLRPSDPQRILRALEVFEATGISLAEWQMRPGIPVLQDGNILKLVVCPERDILYQRCNQRFLSMMDQGCLEEVSAFPAYDIFPETPLFGALGLKPLQSFLKGELSKDEAISLSQRDTRRYAKRQLTWLRRNMITWKWIKR